MDSFLANANKNTPIFHLKLYLLKFGYWNISDMQFETSLVAWVDVDMYNF
jgi:hypothetical protein